MRVDFSQASPCCRSLAVARSKPRLSGFRTEARHEGDSAAPSRCRRPSVPAAGRRLCPAIRGRHSTAGHHSTRPDDLADHVVCDGPLSPVFSATIANDSDRGYFFRVFATVPLPDGRIVLSYDPDAPEAGDETNLGSARIVQREPDGTTTEFPLPVIDGNQVPSTATPLIAGADGTLYMYDDAALRVVARDPSGQWRVVAPIDEGTITVVPYATIGPDGDLYFATATAVFRLGADGVPTTIAGSEDRAIGDITFPEPPIGPLPAPAAAVGLPLLTGVVVADNETVYLTTETAVLAVSPGGIISLIADATAGGALGDGQVAIPTVPGPGERSLFTGLALDSDGSILVADTGLQRLLRISPAGAEVLLNNVSSIESGTVVGRSPTTNLLVYRGGGEVVCSYVQ